MEEWDQEMETKPKLEILKRIVKLGEWSECSSGEKGGQEYVDKTERRHSRISNRDRKMEGGDQTG